jgi:hypothetical protein
MFYQQQNSVLIQQAKQLNCDSGVPSSVVEASLRQNHTFR